jgi:hypothetical protein
MIMDRATLMPGGRGWRGLCAVGCPQRGRAARPLRAAYFSQLTEAGAGDPRCSLDRAYMAATPPC